MTKDMDKTKIIKSILNIRCREGATIADIESDYEQMIGEPLMDSYDYLNSIDCVYCTESQDNVVKWFVRSDKMQHISKLILEQKPAQPKPMRPQRALIRIGCYFEDNIVYNHIRKYKYHSNQRQEDINNNIIYSHKNGSIGTPPRLGKPTLHAQLVGDDFFRTLASESTTQLQNRKYGIQQAGLCVSGLKIQAAAKLIETTPNFKSTRLIINVGSVDILHGGDLIEMCADYENLIKACERRGLQPIITTLAPLANSGHSPEMLVKLREFNVFLLDKFFAIHEIIDIWSKMTNPRGITNFDCYRPKSNYVSGSSRPHVLWNQTGQKLIRNHIQCSLKMFLKLNHTQYLEIDA